VTGDRFRHGTKLLRFRPDKAAVAVLDRPNRRAAHDEGALPSCATGPLAILRLACPPRRSIDLTGRIATIFGRELNVD
jgi:hypothetical protein